jgi:YidC/Oxa1 family membrane protein insertase
MSGSFLDPVYTAVAKSIVAIHKVLQPAFGETNGYGWALSIVLLTVAVRILIFPLFVKQIKSQRQLQLMQPKVKELREKYKHDKAKMQEEMMRLQKEHGNPLLGCMPILLQIPLFIALFRVLNAFRPRLQTGGTYNGQSLKHQYIFVASHGISAHTAQVIGNAKVFGVPLSVAFRTGSAELKSFGHQIESPSFNASISGGTVKAVAGVMIILMCLSIYGTQRQIIGRQGPVDPSQRAQQRIMLYLSPGMLLISGLLFPIGVLTYWLTTNVWSMGQQFFVLKRMPAPGSPTTAAAGGKDVAQPSVRFQQVRRNEVPDEPSPEPRPTSGDGPKTPPPAGGPTRRPTGGRPQQRGRSGSKNRRGGRR